MNEIMAEGNPLIIVVLGIMTFLMVTCAVCWIGEKVAWVARWIWSKVS